MHNPHLHPKISIASLPTHIMQVIKLPDSILHQIDKLHRNFLWGSSSTKRKLHLVNWNQVCKPLIKGGLGIPKVEFKNKSLIMGLACRFHNSDTNSLWYQVIASKYKPKHPASGSQIWKSITLGWNLCQEGLSYHMDDERSISFLSDKWCTKSPLRSLIQGPLPENHFTHTVNHYISNKTWNLLTIPFVFPKNILNKITSTFIPKSLSDDSIVWDYAQNGLFSMKSSYNLLLFTFSHELACSDSKKYSWLWKNYKHYLKLKFYLAVFIE